MSQTVSAISIKGLTKDFSVTLRGVKLRAVDALNLEVAEGQVYGLLGPNGSGKSTTIKIILGLLEATVGDVRVFWCAGAQGGGPAQRRLPAGGALFLSLLERPRVGEVLCAGLRCAVIHAKVASG